MSGPGHRIMMEPLGLQHLLKHFEATSADVQSYAKNFEAIVRRSDEELDENEAETFLDTYLTLSDWLTFGWVDLAWRFGLITFANAQFGLDLARHTSLSSHQIMAKILQTDLSGLRSESLTALFVLLLNLMTSHPSNATHLWELIDEHDFADWLGGSDGNANYTSEYTFGLDSHDPVVIKDEMLHELAKLIAQSRMNGTLPQWAEEQLAQLDPVRQMIIASYGGLSPREVSSIISDLMQEITFVPERAGWPFDFEPPRNDLQVHEVRAMNVLLLSDPEIAFLVLTGPSGSEVLIQQPLDHHWMFSDTWDQQMADILRTGLLDYPGDDPVRHAQAYNTLIAIAANVDHDWPPEIRNALADIVVMYLPLMVSSDMPADLRSQIDPDVLPVASDEMAELINMLIEDPETKSILMTGLGAHTALLVRWAVNQDDMAEASVVAAAAAANMYDYVFAGTDWRQDKDSGWLLSAGMFAVDVLERSVDFVPEEIGEVGKKRLVWLQAASFAATIGKRLVTTWDHNGNSDATSEYLQLTALDGSRAGPDTKVPAVSPIEITIALGAADSGKFSVDPPPPMDFGNDPSGAAETWHRWKNTWPADFQQAVITMNRDFTIQLGLEAENLHRPPVPGVSPGRSTTGPDSILA